LERVNRKEEVIEFGMDYEWAVGVDDHCLVFYPQYSIHGKEVKATHLWKEAIKLISDHEGIGLLKRVSEINMHGRKR